MYGITFKNMSSEEGEEVHETALCGSVWLNWSLWKMREGLRQHTEACVLTIKTQALLTHYSIWFYSVRFLSSTFTQQGHMKLNKSGSKDF